jgi:hypothetical protein
MRSLPPLFLLIVAVPADGRAQSLPQSLPQSQPATAPASRGTTPDKKTGKTEKKKSPAKAEEGAASEEEASYPSWTLSASAGATGGYDSKATLSRNVILQESKASGTTELTAKLGPTLSVTETLSTSLEYSFGHKLNYSDHNLDEQTHGLELGGKYAGERVEASLSYAVSFSILLPKDVFYSIEHQPKASLSVLIVKPFYVAAEYSFHYYDIHDPSADAQAAGGQVHTVDIYPDLYFSERLDIYAGYELELAKLGMLRETWTFNTGATVPYDSDQSYKGHFFYLHVKGKPHTSLSLTLDGKIGRKLFPNAVIPPGPGPGGKGEKRGRGDTFARVELTASWSFWKDLSLDGYFSYEHSGSTLSTQRQLSSYDSFTGTLGLSWSHDWAL